MDYSQHPATEELGMIGDGCGRKAELQVLNRIVNLYLEYAELQALARKPMTMRDWIAKLDDFLKASGRELLNHAGKITAEAAKAKARVGILTLSGVAGFPAARGGCGF